MNCCDEYGNCNQDRDCPIRTGRAKVVRIGRQGRNCPARTKGHYLAKWLLIVIAVLLASAAVVAAVVGVSHA